MKHNDLKKEKNNLFGNFFKALPYLALLYVAVNSFIYLFFIKEQTISADVEILLETAKKLNYELKGFSAEDEPLGDSYIFIFEKKE